MGLTLRPRARQLLRHRAIEYDVSGSHANPEGVRNLDWRKAMKRRSLLAAAALSALVSPALAAPYASSVSITGTTVTFTLNEDASTLAYTINGGAPISLDGSTKGTKTFNLNSPTDKFAITASKVSGGYAFANGFTTAAAASGLGVASTNGGYNLVSSDTNPLVKFNSPRGVAVNTNPNAGSLFGVSYVANSAAATAGRLIGDGLYGLKGDGSDATGRGDTASIGPAQWPSTGNAPYRLTVGPDNNVFIADFGDASSYVGYNNPALTDFTQVLAGNGNPGATLGSSNHGSTHAVYPTGSLAQGNLVLYTLDEDLTPAYFGGTGTATQNLWRYDVGAGTAGGSTVVPTKVNVANTGLLAGATCDMDVGKDGKFYLAQNRQAGADAGLFILDATGVKIYDSLADSRSILASPTANDILRNVQGVAVSPDQKYLALMLNNSDVAVVPLINGIPDLANRLLIDTGTDVNSGRDIAFDAADNIYYVSSGQAIYRVFSPGGAMSSTLTWDGTSFSFVAVPEPGTVGLLGAAALGLLARRRRTAR